MNPSANEPKNHLGRLGLLTLAALLAGSIAVTACGGSADDTGSTGAVAVEEGPGVRVVSPSDAAALIDAPEPPVVIDVRTPEEYAEGHVEGAILIDFYRDDFVDAIDELDHSRPYVIYCRSGNRSSQAREVMADLGFTDVADIDGGIAAWQSNGLPTVR